jgi:hypothetical protein
MTILTDRRIETISASGVVIILLGFVGAAIAFAAWFAIHLTPLTAAGAIILELLYIVLTASLFYLKVAR